MTPPTDLEYRLRSSLAEHAADAPRGGPLADRILAELDAPVLRPRRGWRTWALPLLAAAAIAAVALALVGVGHIRYGTAPSKRHEAGTHAAVSPTTQPPPTARPSSAPTTLSQHGPVLPIFGGVAGLRGFRATDTTYFGDWDAWALGAARCRTGSAQTCPALAATTDGGSSWHRESLPSGISSPGTPDATCAAGCVRGVRFANDHTGYLFGPRTFFMTDGHGWAQQPGGAVAVETLDNTVVRVSLADDTCTGECRYEVSYSAVGATTWTAAGGLPALTGDGVQLVRAKGVSYLLVRTASGGRLYRSRSGGATWTAVPGCSELRSVALGRGSLDLLCANQLVVGADSPLSHRVDLPGGSGMQVSAVGPGTLFAAGDALYRSTDGGATWQVVLDHPSDPASGPPGFQSETLGRWLTDGGRVIWTTTDGGRSWSGLAFSR